MLSNPTHVLWGNISYIPTVCIVAFKTEFCKGYYLWPCPGQSLGESLRLTPWHLSPLQHCKHLKNLLWFICSQTGQSIIQPSEQSNRDPVRMLSFDKFPDTLSAFWFSSIPQGNYGGLRNIKTLNYRTSFYLNTCCQIFFDLFVPY